MTKRSIVMTENDRMLFRLDINMQSNTPESDVIHALVDMDKAGIINIEKVTMSLHEKYGVVISPCIDTFVEKYIIKPMKEV